MSKFEIEFKYKVEEFGYEVLDASDKDHAENVAMQTIREFYPEAVDIEIVEVREING